jgi:hypothetical protein
MKQKTKGLLATIAVAIANDPDVREGAKKLTKASIRKVHRWWSKRRANRNAKVSSAHMKNKKKAASVSPKKSKKRRKKRES